VVTKAIVISASVVADDHEQAARAAEVLARAVTGLALEGINVGINMSQVEDEEEAADDGAG
jgi:hypothetical protein